MNGDLLYFNGIDCASGDYYTQPLSIEQLSELILGRQKKPDNLSELQHKSNHGAAYGLPNRLAQHSSALDKVGWAVILPKDADEQLKRALKPLLDLRNEQAGPLYKECVYMPGDDKVDFFRRYEVDRGPTQPEKLPYYLLIVGNPLEIPFTFQYQLDVEYAVGRIYFETHQEYANYTAAVVAAENARLDRDMSFFSVETPDDDATRESHNLLVKALGQELQKGDFMEAHFTTIDGDQATKENLSHLLDGDQAPALLLTTSHGAGFPAGHELQRSHQGALITREFPGPKKWQRAVVEPEYYFSGDDLSPDGNLVGSVAFLFACFGGGTPVYDDFWRWNFQDSASVIAPDPFLAR